MGIVVRRRHTMAQPPDEFKIVVVGAGGVGKSGLTLQFCAGKCPKRYDPTIEDSYRKTTDIDGRQCTLDILDTAGQEEYAALRSEYMQEGKGFILVYSITQEESFAEMDAFKKQIEEVRSTSGTKVPICLVGNKIDLEAERKVTCDQGEQKAKAWRSELASNSSSPISEVLSMETSAMAKTNVDEVFKGLVKTMFKGKPAPAQSASGGAAPAPAPEASTSGDQKASEKSGGCKCAVM